MRLSNHALSSGALFEVSGVVPNQATWQENIYFSEAGQPFDLTGLSFKMTFRADPADTSADYTLSTTAGTLSIAEDADSGVDQILYINVAAGTLSSLVGDYICDLASEDASDVVTLWAHGVVTFTSNPVAF